MIYVVLKTIIFYTNKNGFNSKNVLQVVILFKKLNNEMSKINVFKFFIILSKKII